MAHRGAEIERSPTEVAALAGQARLQLSREGMDRPAHLDELLPGGVHEVDVLGERLAEGAGERLDAAVGDEAPADLRLDLLAELLDPRLVLVGQEPLLEGA